MTTILECIVRQALAYEAEAFETDADISGADLVEWFAERRAGAEAALQSLQPVAAISILSPKEESMRFRTFYEHCGQQWEDIWSCTCNDECPVCGAEIEPYKSEDLATDGEEGVQDSEG